MNMKGRGKWVLLGILLGAIALTVSICSDLRRRADEVLNRHDLSTRDRIAALRRTHLRTPLFEPAIEGNAWDLYRPAIEVLSQLPQAEQDEFPALRGDSKPLDPSKVEPIVDKYRPQIDQLRKALQCRLAEPGYPYEEGFSMQLPHITRSLTASKFLAGAIDLRHRQNRDREAVELSLVTLGMARDIARKGSLVNHLVLIVEDQITLQQLETVLASHSLSGPDLEGLCAGLDRLAADPIDLMDTIRTEELIASLEMIKIGRGTHSLPELTALFRYGFSSKIMAAQALNEYEAYVLRLDECRRLPPSRRMAAIDEATNHAINGSNPLIQLLLPSMSRAWKNLAVADMRLALARIAAALAWHQAEKGSFPAALSGLVPRYLPRLPEDPFTGMAFRYADSGTSAKVWSIGGDGDDDGGRPMTDENIDSDGDVVWTIKRK